MLLPKFWHLYLKNWFFNNSLSDFYDFKEIRKVLSLNKHEHSLLIDAEMFTFILTKIKRTLG